MLRGRLDPPDRAPRPDFALAQVNIVLLLVLFFLVVGTLIETDESSVDLPRTAELPLERLPRPLLLIAPDGAWSLDGADLSRAETLARLAEGEEGPRRVHILAGRDVAADHVLSAMQALGTAGLGVTLVTLKEEPRP